jgi:hypothetical protein
VAINREQHRPEHDIVVPVELAADDCDQILSIPGRILVAPARDGDPSPC